MRVLIRLQVGGVGLVSPELGSSFGLKCPVTSVLVGPQERVCPSCVGFGTLLTRVRLRPACLLYSGLWTCNIASLSRFRGFRRGRRRCGHVSSSGYSGGAGSQRCI